MDQCGFLAVRLQITSPWRHHQHRITLEKILLLMLPKNESCTSKAFAAFLPYSFSTTLTLTNDYSLTTHGA